jgi:hypothetical protein
VGVRVQRVGFFRSLPPPTPCSIDPDFAPLASGAFYEVIGTATFYETIIIDDFVKSLKMPFFVIPVKAGIRLFPDVPDPGFRRGDKPVEFFRSHRLAERSKNP